MVLKTLDAPPRAVLKEKMTFEEFLAWCDEDTRAEWVNGEIIMTSPASTPHQRITFFAARLLAGFVERKELGEVFTNPLLMRLANVPSGREPDVLVVLKEHANRIKKTFLDGPADLVVEVISPESVGCDRGEKFVEYEQAGIPEYWLIDPDRRRAEFYRLDAQGMYRLIEPDAQGIYHSAVVDGFWLRVEWLWQEPLPMEEDVLREIREKQRA